MSIAIAIYYTAALLVVLAELITGLFGNTLARALASLVVATVGGLVVALFSTTPMAVIGMIPMIAAIIFATATLVRPVIAIGMFAWKGIKAAGSWIWAKLTNMSAKIVSKFRKTEVPTEALTEEQNAEFESTIQKMRRLGGMTEEKFEEVRAALKAAGASFKPEGVPRTNQAGGM